MAKIDLKNINRILSIHHQLAMGESILLSAPFNAIRSALPDASVSIVAGGYACEFLEHMPWVDLAIPIERFGIFMGKRSKALRLLHRPFIVSRLSGFLRRHDFDCVFLRDDERLPYTGLIRAAVKRAGIDTVISLKPLLEKHMLDSRPVVDSYLEIVKDLGFQVNDNHQPVLTPDEKAGHRITKQLADRGIDADSHKLVGICGQSRLKIKSWDNTRVAELHRLLSRDPDVRTILFSTGTEYAGTAAEFSGNRLMVTGWQTFDDLTALIARCDLFISVDSGPMHLAAALGIPIVAVFGPTPGRIFGPHTDQRVILQKTPSCPAYRPETFFSSQNGGFQTCYLLDKCLHLDSPCTNLVSAEEVYEAATGFLYE